MGEHEKLTGSFHDIILITEFKGTFPEVPVFKDVDIRELTNNEPNPVFVTLPIGKANVVSGNKRYYDESFLQEMDKQVRANKPIGLMGHLPSDQRSFSFPTEAVHWIGTMRVKEYLLGKGFLPEGDARSRMQRYRATNKKIATSIDATGEGEWDDSINAYRMIAETLVLNQIDIAPADRAGIADLSAVPLLTTEMMTDSGIIVVNTTVGKKEKKMEKDEVIRELKSADASLLPDEVKNAIVQEYAKGVKTALGFESSDLVAEVKKIRERDEIREKQAVTARIKEIASVGDKAIKLEDIREMVVDMVELREPKTVEDVDRIYAEVCDKDSVKKALASSLQETMGPSQGLPVSGKNSEGKGGMKGNWFVLPAEKQ
jgi:hypothetical protein